MKRLMLAVAFISLAAGCAEQGEPAAVLAEDTTFPHVVAGWLEVSVEEGPVSADDISEVNFAELTIGERVYMVSIAGDVIRAAGASREDLVGGKAFEVTLSGVDPLSDSVGVTFYSVSKLELQD